jgi:tetratricopeptide (TPR) repeat protein
MIEQGLVSNEGQVLGSASKWSTRTKSNTGNKHDRASGSLHLRLICILLGACLVTACSHSGKASPTGSILLAANDFFAQGDYEASIGAYQKLIDKAPETADRVLFEMGIIYAHPDNKGKSYQKALGCFRKIINAYPESEYRRDSQMMVLQIQNVIIKDNLIAEQQTQIDTYRQRMKARENAIADLQKKAETLEQKVFELRREPVDKVLIEKKKRLLSLISGDETIKTYKVALGTNPVGPKERVGDLKTPEGTYIIESRNRNSAYHLALRISYPNDRDKLHAQELGFSPGGDIMIHGLKNALAWVGSIHSGMDWTEGCIAVTNDEIEEIARLVPDGTPVEIRP